MADLIQANCDRIVKEIVDLCRREVCGAEAGRSRWIDGRQGRLNRTVSFSFESVYHLFLSLLSLGMKLVWRDGCCLLLFLLA